MRLEGSLDAFSLPDIFALLSMTKKTGGLHLRRGDQHGVVWFDSGSLTGGSPDEQRQSLARRVVAGTRVDQTALQAAISRSRADSIGLTAALVRTGAVDEGALHEIASEHVVDVVFDLLRWSDGDFEFVIDEPDGDGAGVARAVEDVVAEARRRLEDWEAVRSSLPRPDAVLHLTASSGDQIVLDRDQWSMLVLADGRRNVAELVSISGRGEYAAVRCLAGLVGAEVLGESADAGVVCIADRAALLDAFEGRDPAPLGQSEPAVQRPVVALPALDEDVADAGAIAPDEAEADSVAAFDHSEIVDHDDDADDAVDQDGAADQEAADSADTGDQSSYPRIVPIAQHELTSLNSHNGNGNGHNGNGNGNEASAALAELAGPLRSATRDLSGVTPQRPEPFLPDRTPDHPDEPAALPAPATVGALAATAAPAAATHIERDPSVNKSLLLRLIAGVRGL